MIGYRKKTGKAYLHCLLSFYLSLRRLWRHYDLQFTLSKRGDIIFYGIDRLVSCNTADTAVLYPQVVVVRTACLLKAELFGIPFRTLIIDLFVIAAVLDLNAVYPFRQELYFMDIPIRLTKRVGMD